MSMVSMLSFIQGYTRADISMAVQKCAQVSNNTRFMHKRTVMD